MTSRMFSTSRFNTSIKCLLSCLKVCVSVVSSIVFFLCSHETFACHRVESQELSDFATGNDPSLQLPYKITEVKVADITVDLDKPLQWTRAMKFMLTNLKWLLSWACKWRRGPAGLA